MSNEVQCASCGVQATYLRACGHYYCEVCTDLCDPITHRFDRNTGEWTPCDESKQEMAHVNITVAGEDPDEVAAVDAAISRMMHEKFEVISQEYVSFPE